MPSDTANPSDLHSAADAFLTAWATGQWTPFTDMFADDFIFQFPAGEHSGRHEGAAARRHMEAWSSDAAANARVNGVETLRMVDRDWIVFTLRSEGEIGGQPYKGVEAVFLRMQDGKIIEYREYISELGNIGN